MLEEQHFQQEVEAGVLQLPHQVAHYSLQILRLQPYHPQPGAF